MMSTNPDRSEAAVSVDRVTVQRGRRKVLREVTCEAPAGRVTAIVGPNGSGKSTLLGAITHSLVPSSGSVSFFGTPNTSRSMRELARMRSVVAQQHDTWAGFSVNDIVRMGCDAGRGVFEFSRHSDSLRVREALSATQTAYAAERDFASLSGGEQQRVLISRALAQQAPVMVLDEPTNHLDLASQINIMELIGGLDKTVVLALHDLNLARHYADQVILLSAGSVAAQGPTAKVLTAERISRLFAVSADEVAHPRTGQPHFLFTPPQATAEPP
ncbi:ABC transporter ATP-binding protein [Corynebacterium heidelbergense]|uniref:ABC transporter domain-containing protein n=1 Tax=Corynebacterium heidelbergense TaxID=2055947 RepID=A0A364V8M1_9CORY|nr:ABC transporter ATP-binding protein [Corynebacterium heidelbergense]RAV32967.1 hypothetical protein DLJ54_00775 [Corynebacterium heidelbergense]